MPGCVKYGSLVALRRFATLEGEMAAAVRITRMDSTAAQLRKLATRSREATQSRRLLAIAMMLDGRSVLKAVRQTGVDWQILRDWVHRYNVGRLARKRFAEQMAQPHGVPSVDKDSVKDRVVYGQGLRAQRLAVLVSLLKNSQ